MLPRSGTRILLALGAAAGSSYALSRTCYADQEQVVVSVDGAVPARAQQLKSLRGYTKDKPCDLLIIGGGATGAGCAVDAATR
jgi:glycerol-3-phosphate dehydrogenase